MVREVELNFVSLPSQSNLHGCLESDPEEKVLVDIEITKLLEKGAMKEVTSCEGIYFQYLLTVEGKRFYETDYQSQTIESMH